ncbi:MAG: SRPBCC domain-containing protein [Deltaproteobacteria bacterium]|nr:SRPBCC domain-containing protein [Deltaproteobacteria bacterium]MBW2387536.1 SRPBCC domain-containing protein [Deltaproteobacteria bacterium]MBW2726040.1 SRPBCC domain-containing protein [Deltaproteobacteria bacterium]
MPRTLSLAASMPVDPELLFDMYLDSDRHAAFTGSPVTIGSKPGSPFQAFEGTLSGSILHTVPKRLIVQSWRSVNFAEGDIDSTLILSFWPIPDGARIELVHVNVPEADFAGVSEGWGKFYFAPWREYLETQSK